jgi:phage terminase large subunit
MPFSKHKKNQKEAELRRHLRDPAGFAETVLGQPWWPIQRQIAASVARHARTAVKACHASGKTFAAARLVLWWITTHREGVAITSAPTWTQVERVLWPEIHRAVAHARIEYPKPTSTALHLDTHRYAIGLATNEGPRMQGFHGDLLVVLDEAPGIRPELWEAIEGMRAGGDVRVLALGNPTVASGPFYDAFAQHRSGWNTITISAFDTPNLAGLTVESLLAMSEEELGQDVCPYLTSRRWVKEKYAEWGPGHPLWEARVLGQFPQQGDGALISLAWLEAAQQRSLPVAPDGDWAAGIDVAEGGDNETVLVVRCNGQVVLKKAWAQRDPRGEVAAALRPYRSRLRRVNVDNVGVGAYFSKGLADEGYPVYEINAGAAPRHSERFVNLKAEMYWGLRERCESEDIAGLDDQAVAQLAAVRYEVNARGQIVIESKEEMRKRGVKSPDHAEAIMLAFAKPREQGLFEVWRERAEELKRKGAANHGQELAQAQKDEVPGWPRRSAGPATARLPKPERCPNCDSPGLAYYHETWKCNLCRQSGSCESG